MWEWEKALFFSFHVYPKVLCSLGLAQRAFHGAEVSASRESLELIVHWGEWQKLNVSAGRCLWWLHPATILSRCTIHCWVSSGSWFNPECGCSFRGRLAWDALAEGSRADCWVPGFDWCCFSPHNGTKFPGRHIGERDWPYCPEDSNQSRGRMSARDLCEAENLAWLWRLRNPSLVPRRQRKVHFSLFPICDIHSLSSCLGPILPIHSLTA